MKFLSYLFCFALLNNNGVSYTNKYIIGSIKNLLVMKKDLSERILYDLYKPKTYNQIKYVDCLNNKEDSITIAVGPAGTGKTLMACRTAINYFKDKKIDKIIITRPAVSVEEEIGFLPGTIVKKMDPWTRPILDIFEEYYSKIQINNMIVNGQIEISPLGFMRGRTFKNAFIIADEMQNSSPTQMYMLLTRIGINSRMAITGDLEQSDKSDTNGLKDLINKYKLSPNITNIMLVELNQTDVHRSKLVNEVINMYTNKPVQKLVEKDCIPINVISRIKINNINHKNNKVNEIYKKQTGFDDAALIPYKDYYGNKW
jgi:phosphate starvation-inducible PhoH-like protein